MEQSDGIFQDRGNPIHSHSSVPIPTEAQMLAGDIPKGLEVIDLDIEYPGIEPYSFLELDR